MTPATRPHSPARVLLILLALLSCGLAGGYAVRLYRADRKQSRLDRIATAMSRGEWEAARGLISAGLVDETDPKAVSRLFMKRATLHVSTREGDWLVDSAKDAKRAIDADPENLDARGYHAGCLVMLGDRHRAILPDQAAEFFRTAVEEYTDLIGREPGDYRHRIGRAKAYARLGEPGKAEADCRHAIQLNADAKTEAHAILPGRF